ncbi:uncharacterized protein SAPINGB_P001279 [Magnusiomyces paraingens]|uniref:EF-hand domain-containing protein n=1 Tax=Magnusiomyces paraingens TaxID=2606893 RepID=A0A5E8B4W3_9ASCO|nr:uncharacterized protein SAPINGB_P001279 [Saprochaete ingens]VVT46570.1 unnamed protein product [Saprochaete ingens]
MPKLYSPANADIPLSEIDLERQDSALHQVGSNSSNTSNTSRPSINNQQATSGSTISNSSSHNSTADTLRAPQQDRQSEKDDLLTDSSDSSDDELVALNQVVGSLESKNITKELNKGTLGSRDDNDDGQAISPQDSHSPFQANAAVPLQPNRAATTVTFRRTETEDSDSDGDQHHISDERARRRRGHRHSLTPTKSSLSQKKDESDNKAVRYFRKIFLKVFHMSVFFRCFFYWLPLAIAFFIPLAVGAWGRKDASIGHVPLKWLFIWVEVVWAAVFVSRIVAHLLPVGYYFLTSIFAPRLKKYCSVLQAMEIPVTLVFSSLIAVSTFMPVMTWKKNASKKDATQTWQTVVQNILVATLISSLVYCAERTIIHLISVSFHKKRFANRIKDNKHSIFVLSELLCAACVVFPPFSPEFMEEDMKLQSGKFYSSISDGHTTISKKIATNKKIQKLFGRVNRAVDAASSPFTHHAGGAAATSHSPVVAESDTEIRTWCNNIVADAVNSKKLSETLAKRIWLSLVLEDEEALTMNDLQEVLGPEKKSDYEIVFQTLDIDGNGDLTLDEMISSVREISHERKSIYRSLKDVDTAIAKLHSVLLFVVFIIIVIIFIGMLSPSVTAVLATLGTTILGLSFMFSTTAQEITASCVFLFVKHPIDVGDRVDILSVAYVVKEISLLSTVFTRVLDATIVQAPNSVLNTLWIDNVSRSGPQGYQFDLILGLPETTMSQLESFEQRMVDFCEENSRDYGATPFFYCTGYPDLDRVKLTINVVFRSNFADGLLYSKRRNKLIRFVGRCIHDLNLHVPRREDNATDPGLPMYYNNGRDNNELPFNNPTREVRSVLEQGRIGGITGRRQHQDMFMSRLGERRARMGFQDEQAAIEYGEDCVQTSPVEPPVVIVSQQGEPSQPKLSVLTSIIPEEEEEEEEEERKAIGVSSAVASPVSVTGARPHVQENSLTTVLSAQHSGLERHGTTASRASGSTMQAVTSRTGRRRRSNSNTTGSSVT